MGKIEESNNVRANLVRIGALGLATKIAKAHGVSLDDVLGRAQSKTVASARRELWCIVKDTFAFSYPETGAVFGRDHTTIMNALKVRQCELAGLHGSTTCICDHAWCPRAGSRAA